MLCRNIPLTMLTAALLLCTAFTGCSKTGGDETADNGAKSPKGPAANGNGSASKPWQGDLTTRIGGVKEYRELVESHKGKVVVVDMWSTWCGPCVKELHGLAELQKKHGDKVVCIAVDLDYDGTADTKPAKTQDKVEEVLRKRFGTVLDTDESLNPAFRLFISSAPDEEFGEAIGHNGGVPVIFVFDKQGKPTKIDLDYVTKLGAKDISYEKHVNPLVEKLLAK